MKTKFTSATLLAATAVLGLGIGSAFADSEGGTIPDTFFTELPGVTAQTPVQNAPSVAAQNGQGVHAYVTQSSHGTWLSGFSHGGDGTEG
jgi:hypothetical protein